MRDRRERGRGRPGRAVLGAERGKGGRSGREKKKRKRKGGKEKGRGEKKWRKEERKWKKKERERKGGGECTPAATAAAVGHARRRLHVRGPGVGGARAELAAKRRPGARGREWKREREIRSDDRDGR